MTDTIRITKVSNGYIVRVHGRDKTCCVAQSPKEVLLLVEMALKPAFIVNAEAGAFAATNAHEKSSYFKVTKWPATGSGTKGANVNNAMRVYCDTIKSEMPGAKIIWNGFSTQAFTPDVVARMDGWLPMRY